MSKVLRWKQQSEARVKAQAHKQHEKLRLENYHQVREMDIVLLNKVEKQRAAEWKRLDASYAKLEKRRIALLRECKSSISQHKADQFAADLAGHNAKVTVQIEKEAKFKTWIDSLHEVVDEQIHAREVAEYREELTQLFHESAGLPYTKKKVW